MKKKRKRKLYPQRTLNIPNFKFIAPIKPIYVDNDVHNLFVEYFKSTSPWQQLQFMVLGYPRSVTTMKQLFKKKFPEHAKNEVEVEDEDWDEIKSEEIKVEEIDDDEDEDEEEYKIMEKEKKKKYKYDLKVSIMLKKSTSELVRIHVLREMIRKKIDGKLRKLLGYLVKQEVVKNEKNDWYNDAQEFLEKEYYYILNNRKKSYMFKIFFNKDLNDTLEYIKRIKNVSENNPSIFIKKKKKNRGIGIRRRRRRRSIGNFRRKRKRSRNNEKARRRKRRKIKLQTTLTTTTTTTTTTTETNSKRIMVTRSGRKIKNIPELIIRQRQKKLPNISKKFVMPTCKFVKVKSRLFLYDCLGDINTYLYKHHDYFPNIIMGIEYCTDRSFSKNVFDLVNIFQTELPNMTIEYICNIVRDVEARIIICKDNIENKVIGGLVFKNHFLFVEIILMAVMNKKQYGGVGSAMINCLKTLIPSYIHNIYVSSDNRCIGFYLKNGFYKNPLIRKEALRDFIYATDRSTPMECRRETGGFCQRIFC